MANNLQLPAVIKRRSPVPPYLPGCPDALGYPVAAASFGPRAAIVAAERTREGWCWVMANVRDDICASGLLLTPEMAKPPNISKATVQRCISKEPTAVFCMIFSWIKQLSVALACLHKTQLVQPLQIP